METHDLPKQNMNILQENETSSNLDLGLQWEETKGRDKFCCYANPTAAYVVTENEEKQLTRTVWRPALFVVDFYHAGNWIESLVQTGPYTLYISRPYTLFLNVSFMWYSFFPYFWVLSVHLLCMEEVCTIKLSTLEVKWSFWFSSRKIRKEKCTKNTRTPI